MVTGMVFGFSNLGVDVLIVNLFALVVHIDPAAADMKPSNHLFNIIANNKRMGFNPVGRRRSCPPSQSNRALGTAKTP